jgi:hypothetical protein
MLQKNWERLEFIRAMENALLMDRAIQESTFKKFRSFQPGYDVGDYAPASVPPISRLPGFSGSWNDDLQYQWSRAKQAFSAAMWHVSWTYSDELQMLQDHQLMLETFRNIGTNHIFNPAFTNMMNQFDAKMNNGRDDWVEKLNLPDLRRCLAEEGDESTIYTVATTMTSETTRQIVITAIALKRYQIKYGTYPSDLNSLAPEFVTAPPADPADGKPLRYHRNADGMFQLYSIGINGNDDGGDPTPGHGYSILGPPPDYDWMDMDNLDWVWPQPATPAEVQYFYDHPPK